MMDKNGLLKAMQATAQMKPRKITVNGWGDLYVKSLTVADVQAQQERNKETENADLKDRRTLALGAANVLCDENGALVFDPANKEHIDLLSLQPWAMLNQVLEASGDLNGMTKKGQEEAKKG
jgi:hypothetical protein